MLGTLVLRNFKMPLGGMLGASFGVAHGAHWYWILVVPVIFLVFSMAIDLLLSRLFRKPIH